MDASTRTPTLTLAELLRDLGLADDDDALPQFWD